MANENKKQLIIEARLDSSKMPQDIKRFEAMVNKAASAQKAIRTNPAIENLRAKQKSIWTTAKPATKSQFAHYARYAENGKSAATRGSNTDKLYNDLFSRFTQKKAGSSPTLSGGTTFEDAAKGSFKNIKAGDVENGKLNSFIASINEKLLSKVNAGAIQAMAAKLAPYVAIAKKAWDVTKKFGSALVKVSKSAIKAAAGFIKSRLNISGMAKGLKNLHKAFVRVVTYKAIRTFLSVVNSGLTTGINNLYKFSSLLEGKFKTSMDNFATSWLYIQNAVGAFAGTIINAVMPVVTALMDRIAEIANMLARFSASLLGSSYYQATKQVQKYSDMVGEAAANQNQLMGFDELNVLSAGSGDVGSMFGDYSEFTDGIGDVESVIDKLIDKINTFVQNFDIEALATKIGKKVNDIVKYFNQLMDGIDFSAMGRKLASGMNKLVETIKPAELGRALTQKINMVVDFIEGFVTKFEWGAAGTWLSNLVASWIDSIHWDKVQSAISGAINGVFAFAKAFITTTNWAEKAAHLAETINGLINQIDWKEVGSTISKWITTLLDMAIAFFKGIDWEAVGRSIYETLAGIDWGDIFTKLGQLVLSAISAMVSTISSALSSRATTKRNEFVQSGSNWDYVPSDSSTTTTKTTTKDASWWEKYYGGSYATGGMPSTGSLFWAGEAGPELVTSVGGRSTVYNEQQLGASIALGNENVVAAINTLIGVVRSKNNNVTISASDIRKAVNSSSMRLGV